MLGVARGNGGVAAEALVCSICYRMVICRRMYCNCFGRHAELWGTSRSRLFQVSASALPPLDLQ